STGRRRPLTFSVISRSFTPPCASNPARPADARNRYPAENAAAPLPMTPLMNARRDVSSGGSMVLLRSRSSMCHPSLPPPLHSLTTTRHAPPLRRPVGQAVFHPIEIKNQRNLERFRVSARAGALVSMSHDRNRAALAFRKRPLKGLRV